MMKIQHQLAMFRCSNAAGTDLDAAVGADTGALVVPLADLRGIQYVRLVSSGPGGGPFPLAVITEADAFSPAANSALETAALISGYNGATWDRIRALSDNADGVAAATLGAIAALARMQAWNGASYDRLRTPNVFKTGTATASGSTAIWTPAAGKKFRLMGAFVEVSETATLAASGLNKLQFFDAATAIGISFQPWIPNAVLTTNGVLYQSHWVTPMGNGYLSSTINNALNINLATALTAGLVNVNVFGTEE